MSRSRPHEPEATEHGEATAHGQTTGSDDTLGADTGPRLVGRPVASDPSEQIAGLRVLRKLGAGAMGEVYLALDAELERPVAVKLLHPDLVHVGHHAERMRREAKALAKLAHPNVVHVYEVGTHDERVFLAMEYVEGQSLGEWLRSGERRWTEVLDAYLAAGEGLAAAHAAGLIHRDFKPDNVLVGNEGRICVADFGLAVASDRGLVAHPPLELDTASSSGAGTLDERLSRTGAVVGTPNYMPLEQVRGGVLDARSDQFAFCVALYEGLYGGRPFGSGNLVSRINSLMDDQPLPPPRSEVPRWVWPILRRGLAREPDQRWPDMPSLLGELRAAPRRRRKRWWAASLALPLAAVAAWLALAPPPRDPCAGLGEELGAVWNAERREAIRAWLSSSDKAWGRDNGERVVTRVDTWAERWTQARTQVCRSEQQQLDVGTQGPLVAHARACLEQRRSELDELLGLLDAADPVLQSLAQSSVDGLADPLACEAIARAGLGLDPPPPAQGEAIAGLRRELAGVEALLLAGRRNDALAGVEALLERAEAIGYVPHEAELRFAKGRALLELERLQDARRELELAVDLAEASRHEHLTISIWMTLADRVAPLMADLDAGDRYFRRMRARVLAARREQELGGELDVVEGHLILLRGHPLDAIAPLERAFEWFDARARGFERMRARRLLAAAYERAGRGDDAISQYRGWQRDAEQIYGPSHPKVADASYDLGVALHERGSPEAARVELDRALAIWAEAPSPSSSALLDAHLVLAMLEFSEDRLGAAEQHARAAEQLARTQGDDNPLALAQANAALAAIHYHGGEYPLAVDEFDAAADAFEAADPSDPLVVQTRLGLGWAALLAGQAQRAERAFEFVRTRAGLEADSSEVIGATLGLASLALAAGERVRALDWLARLPAELPAYESLQRAALRVLADEHDDEQAMATLRRDAERLPSGTRRELDALIAHLERAEPS